MHSRMNSLLHFSIMNSVTVGGMHDENRVRRREKKVGISRLESFLYNIIEAHKKRNLISASGLGERTDGFSCWLLASREAYTP
jgi:hypothetical protein